MSTATESKFLERDPKSCYKQLSIKGRRVKAHTLYGAYVRDEDPMTIEEISADRDLLIEAVREVIAYCASDPPELLEDYRREETLIEAA